MPPSLLSPPEGAAGVADGVMAWTVVCVGVIALGTSLNMPVSRGDFCDAQLIEIAAIVDVFGCETSSLESSGSAAVGGARDNNRGKVTEPPSLLSPSGAAARIAPSNSPRQGSPTTMSGDPSRTSWRALFPEAAVRHG